jgi:WXXGXW repeat (2 copies)
MRFPLLLACATLIATAIATAGAADGSVWVEGRWENSGGQYQWRQGYWQTTTTVYTNAPSQPPATTWVEGRWAQGANGWVWVEGHYEQAPTPIATGPTCPPPQPQVVVVERQRPTVVIGAGYNSGYYNNGYGYQRPCPQPVYCPPPVVHCPPPVVHCPPRPVVYAPPARVCLPAPALAFPTVRVGNHRLPLPPIPVFRHR